MKPPDTAFDKIAASVAALSDGARATRTRLRARQETLNSLRAELAALRSAVGMPRSGAQAAAPSAESFDRVLANFVAQTFPAPEAAAPEPAAAQPPLPSIKSAFAEAVVEPAVERSAEPPVEEVSGHPDSALEKLVAHSFPVVETAALEPAAEAPPSSLPVFKPIFVKPADPDPAPQSDPGAAQPVAPQPVAAAAPESPVGDSLVFLGPAAAESTVVLEPAVAESTVVLEPVAAVPVVPEPGASGSASVSKVPRSLLLTAVPVVSLIAVFFVLARFHVPSHPARPKAASAPAAAAAPAPAPVPVPAAAPAPVADPAPPVRDKKAEEALALVQHWHMAGDEKSLFERLGSVVAHPGGVQAWSTEMTDENSYLVVYREPAGTPVYVFETNLKRHRVQPTPEATERLTLIRVRDEATAKLKAIR